MRAAVTPGFNPALSRDIFGQVVERLHIIKLLGRIYRQFKNPRNKGNFILLYLDPPAYYILGGVEQPPGQVGADNDRAFEAEDGTPVARQHFKGKNVEVVLT